MVISLAIQSTYQSIEVGLCFDGVIKAVVQEHKSSASKNIVPLIGSLLAGQNLTFADVEYIAVNQGPAPYTTLRVVIATVNGLAYATGKPIFGVDAFSALAYEISDSGKPTYILLDAFNKDVYYAQVINHVIIQSGCMQTSELPQIIPVNTPIYFIGNACETYAPILTQLYPEATLIPEHSYPQLSSIAIIARHQWSLNPHGKSHISPLYLKEQKYKNQMGIMTSI